MAFSFGTHIFPLNPQSYVVPPIKTIDIGFAVDGTLLLSSPLLNQNEFTLNWTDVIDDFNGIVVDLKNFIANRITENVTCTGSHTFNDGLGLFSGTATLIRANCSVTKKGGAYCYNFALTFKLH
jgi:hypothetical protein